MTSIRTALALSALAAATGLVGTQTAWAQAGRRARAPVVPAAPTPMVTLLSIPAPITPAVALATIAPAVAPATITPAAAGPVGRRPPISQPIPGPVINN